MPTKSTIIYKKWDIVLVPFPFTDFSSIKKRPALIISPDSYNNSGDDVLIAFITSNIPNNLKKGDFLIKNWKTSGLPLPSLLKIKIPTVNKSIIIKTLGVLSVEDKKEFQKVILNFFKDN